jgi:hypothetical protein
MNDDSELQVPARIHQPLRDEQSLREFLLRVPTTDPRKTGREYLAAHRRSRETQVALAVVLAFWLVGGLAFFSAGQRPSVSTTPSAPASACSSVEGGLAPSVSFPSTPCAAPAALAQLMRVTAFGLQEIRTADAYWGSESYSIDWKSKAVVTVAGSWTGSIDVPLTQAEIDAHSTKGATGITVVADGRELAMVVWHVSAHPARPERHALTSCSCRARGGSSPPCSTQVGCQAPSRNSPRAKVRSCSAAQWAVRSVTQPRPRECPSAMA